LPFVTQALCAALGAVHISRMQLPPMRRPPESPHLARDIGQGFAWTWKNPPVRTLTLTIFTFNVTSGPRGLFSCSTPASASAWPRSGTDC
jgi:hypothetical protein